MEKRLIDANNAISVLKILSDKCCDNNSFEQAISVLESVPTIDAVEVVHGCWEVVDQEEPRRYGCSVCKRLSFYVTNYCSYCGAKMDGEVKSYEQTI